MLTKLMFLIVLCTLSSCTRYEYKCIMQTSIINEGSYMDGALYYREKGSSDPWVLKYPPTHCIKQEDEK